MISRRAVAVVVVLGLLAVFGYDLIFIERSNGDGVVMSESTGSISADLSFMNIRYDPTTRELVADLYVRVFAIRDMAITTLALAIRTIGQGDDVRFPYLTSRAGNCTAIVLEDQFDQGTHIQSSTSFECKMVRLNDGLNSAEIWYPFDEYIAPLVFRACVNVAEACSSTPDHPVSVATVRVEPDRTHFVARLSTPGRETITLVLQRRLFLRLVSIVFLTIVVAFVYHLVAMVDPHDTLPKSLGMFAGLWGLRSIIVPASVTVFPTIVEGVVMASFCIIFGILLVRTTNT